MSTAVTSVREKAKGHWREILAALGIRVPMNPKQKAPCPACGGTDRFRFDDQEGRGTWYCNQCDPKAGDGFALLMNVRGCDFPDAIALVEEELGTPRRSRNGNSMNSTTQPKTPIAVSIPPGELGKTLFCYELAHGTPAFYVHRKEQSNGKKSFPQWGPTPNGDRWQCNLDHVVKPKPLYRLPEILAADPNALIVVHEGEKCVHAHVSADLPGIPTTTSGGAGNAKDTDFAPLAGHPVAVCPDHDEPGVRHASQVAALAQVAGAASVKLVHLPNLPEKGDVVDWLDLGGTVHQFQALLDTGEEVDAPTPPSALDAAAVSYRSREASMRAEEDQNTSNAGPDQVATPASLLFMDAGSFLAQTFPPTTFYIEGLLSDDGGGWIAGEEKLGKTFWMLHEAVCLALGKPVAGRFAVPTPRRVVIIEEEDSPRRTHRRLRAIVAGVGVDPDDPEILRQLAERLHLAVWQGFTVDSEDMVKRLDAELARLEPDVCYIDVLRKISRKDLNKGEHAGALLGALDELRRRHGVLFRIVAHNRKSQGTYRAGRGSQELAGSHQLSAWAENSLFFEPIGKKAGQVKLEIQGKDAPPSSAFRLLIESDGPMEDPDAIRLRVEELKTTSPGEEWKERVYEALMTLSPDESLSPKEGRAGISVKQLMDALRCSDKTIRNAIELLKEQDRCLEIGTLSKGAKLYEVKAL